jgi:hypothetical protein
VLELIEVLVWNKKISDGAVPVFFRNHEKLTEGKSAFNRGR